MVPLQFQRRYGMMVDRKNVPEVVFMLKRIVCALGAFWLLVPLAPKVWAEEPVAVVEMPAVVTPMERPSAQEADAQASEDETDAETPAEVTEDTEASNLAALFDAFRAERNLTEDNFAVSYYDTVTGENYDWNETHMLVAASTFKLPLNLYYYEKENAGEIAPDTLITEGGATLDRCHYLSIVESNNEISHALLYRIGTFRDYKIAMRKFFTMTDEEIDPQYYQDNYYCTRMMMDALKYLYARQEDFTEMIDYMKQSNPQNGYFRAKVTECEVAHKYGSFKGAENDVGIFYTEHPFLLAVYTQNVGEMVVQDAARLAADYNEAQTQKLKQQEWQETLDAFEAEKQARMAQAEQRASEAKAAIAAELAADAAAQAAAEQARAAEQEAAQVSMQEETSAPEKTQASNALDFTFDPQNFEWWMIAVAAGVLLLGCGGVYLAVRSGKMKQMYHDIKQDETDQTDDASETSSVPK